MKDLGITLVRQFQTVFGAFIGKEPKVPEFSSGFAGAKIAHYRRNAAHLAEQLKEWAQTAHEEGDEAGSLVLIRLQLIQEELAELGDAMLARDIVESFDALLDLSYVVDGTYITLGLDGYKEAGLLEVHRSNMSKLGEDGKPIISSAGRVVKGPNYSRPDLPKVLAGAPREDHPDDEAVTRFAGAMIDKLAQKREEGRGGWEDKEECSQEHLSHLLRNHVMKGDPVDVANLAMMLHQRGEGIL